MRALKLRHQVTLQRPAHVQDEYGQPVEGDAAWQTVATRVWADIRPTGSSERLAAAQMQSGQTHVLTLRYSDLLAQATGAWRVLYGSRTFGITGLPRSPAEGRQWLVFDCTELRHG